MIAVSHDPSGHTREEGVAAALAPVAARVTTLGAFCSARGPAAQSTTVGSVLCIVEGELINRDELCRALGVERETEPSELVALAYAAWNLGALERLRGAFAVALWDAERDRGLLAGDHAALRPWYVRATAGSVAAATSMRSLLRMLSTAPQPDPIRAMSWLAGFNAPGAQTFALGVERLAGGHAILIEDGRAVPRRWWQPTYREPIRAPRAQVAEQIRTTLGQAVRLRAPEAEITGVLLSGGFDSSAVAGVAASESRAPDQLRTYSASFPDYTEIDESERVRALVSERGLRNRRLRAQPAGIMRLALEYQRDWGIPLAGPGYLMERPLLELAVADGVLGVLDGQGGDEVFGCSPYLIADRVRGGHLAAALRLLSGLPDHPGLPPRAALRRVVRDFAIRPLLPPRVERRLRLRNDAARHMPAWLRRDRLELFLQSEGHLAWREAFEGPLWWRYMADLLANRRAMLSEYIAHRGRDLGLSMRPPLFDVDLAELTLTVPPELAYGGMNRALARESVAGDLPDSVRLAAKKSNHAAFYHHLLSGPDLGPIRALLQAHDARIFDYVDRERLQALLQRPLAVGAPGWTDWSQAVWMALTGEIALRSLDDDTFCDTFIDTHDPPARAHTELR